MALFMAGKKHASVSIACILIFLVSIFLTSCSADEQDIPEVDGNSQAPDQSADASEPLASCPAQCDDGNDCTKDSCSESTGFRCKYSPISPCCGNGIWETGETDETCREDMVNCSQPDGVCKQAVFNPETGACEIVEKMPCCGNGYCDIGEDSDDCPDECASESRVAFQNYPHYMSSPKIVLGKRATSEDARTAAKIENYLEDEIGSAETIVADELTEPERTEMIVVGRPCENSLWEVFFGITSCDEFPDGKNGVIKGMESNGKKIIFVSGDTPENTEKLALVFISPDDYNLTGSNIFMTFDGDDIIFTDK